jgi:hypothetical protein
MASSTVERVQFPLLQHWADYIYRPCTIPYRFPSDPPHQATRTEVLWLEVFRKSIPSFRKRAELDSTVADASEKAEKFALRYGKILDDIQSNPEKHGGPPDGILLCRLRDICLREAGFYDIFRKIKVSTTYIPLILPAWLFTLCGCFLPWGLIGLTAGRHRDLTCG